MARMDDYRVRKALKLPYVSILATVDLSREHATTRNRVLRALTTGLATTSWQSKATQILKLLEQGHCIQWLGAHSPPPSDRTFLITKTTARCMPDTLRRTLVEWSTSYWVSMKLQAEYQGAAHLADKMLRAMERLGRGEVDDLKYSEELRVIIPRAAAPAITDAFAEYHQSTAMWAVCAPLIDAIKRGEPINVPVR